MHYTYVLFSLLDRKLYIGYTKDVHSRLKEHNGGQVNSTKERLPLKLIYFEAYLSKEERNI